MNSLDATLNTDACAGTKDEVNFIEQVEVIVTIKAAKRGELEVYLTSPMGTRSHLLPVGFFLLLLKLINFLNN